MKHKLIIENWRRFLIKENNNDLQDFLEEFSWYQNEGIAKDLSKEELAKIFNDSNTERISVKELDKMGNSYTKLISGNKEEDRFKKFLDFYLKEKRSAETTRADSDEEKEKYLKGLVDGIKNNSIEDPIIVVELEGVGKILAGGRTRAAATKVADVEAKVKILKFSKEQIGDLENAKKVFNAVQA